MDKIFKAFNKSHLLVTSKHTFCINTDVNSRFVLERHSFNFEAVKQRLPLRIITILRAQMLCFLERVKGRNMTRKGREKEGQLSSKSPEEKKFNTAEEVHQFKPLLGSLCAERHSL
jgi:hypothetical protein